MKRKLSVLLLLTPVLIVSFLRTAAFAGAETIEVTIEGNGSGADNTVEVQNNSSTQVNQSNEANVQNDINNNANTGDNSASANTGGENNISTGDISNSTSVTNQMNQNHAESCNCEGNSTDLKISGNGSGSTNYTNVANNSNTNVAQNNTANIYNQVNTYANTGNNNANYNSGNVNIETGSIASATIIKNKNINTNFLKGFTQGTSSVAINISGNGAYSDNIVYFEHVDNISYISNNVFNLENIVNEYLNTGGNNAYGNLGDVWIKTGDIVSSIDILNEGNNNTVELSCKDEDKKTPPVVTPPASGNGHGNGGGGVGGHGDTLGATGQVLPETGSLWLFYATILAGILFISGWYLRFKSGVSPPQA